MDGCRDLANAELVDARTLDSEKIHRRSINQRTRQVVSQRWQTQRQSNRGLWHRRLVARQKHMLSLTWNAPIEAFTREGDFFEGKGVDAVYMPFHKLNEFIGLTRLPTFLCNDVVKNPQVEQYLSDYQAHLEKVFG